MAIHSSILPGKFHGQMSLAGHSPWGCKESDATNTHTFYLRVWPINNAVIASGAQESESTRRISILPAGLLPFSLTHGTEQSS